MTTAKHTTRKPEVLAQHTPAPGSDMNTDKELQQFYARERAALSFLKNKLREAADLIDELEKYPDECLCAAEAKLSFISPVLPLMFSRCKDILELADLRSRRHLVPQ